MSTPRPPVVLLGDLTLVRPLVQASIPFVFVTTSERDVALRSRFVREHLVVGGWDDAALPQLLALGARLRDRHGQRPPLFCGSDPQLELVYRHRDELTAVFALILNEHELAWALHDKGSFYKLCEQRGILAPRTLHASDDLDVAVQRLREPLLVKPRLKSDLPSLREPLFGPAGKARVFETRAELLAHPAWQQHKHQLVVQEHVVGDIGDLCSFHGFCDEENRLLAWFCGRKVRTYPAFGGESSFVELVHDPAIEHAGRELVGKLGIVGPFKIDFIREPHTRALWTLEVNARFTLWCYLGAVSGVNLLAVAYEHLVSGQPPMSPPRYDTGRRWVSLWRDLNAYREQKADLSLAAWLRDVLAPRTLHEVFSWDDPLPFVAWLRDVARKKLR